MKVLLIGGSKGLGAQLKSDLEKEHEVVSLSRSSEIPLDLRWYPEYLTKLTKQVIEFELGGLDALIISSGMGAYLNPTVSGDTVEEMFRINVTGPLAVFRGAQRALLASKGKAMVVGSTVARRPGSGALSVYAATKGALNSWVISEGRRQAKKGIALFAVSPGFFESPMTAEMKPKVYERTVKAIPFGRYGSPIEISQFCVSLLNQTNWCLAGQIFELSGGA